LVLTYTADEFLYTKPKLCHLAAKVSLNRKEAEQEQFNVENFFLKEVVMGFFMVMQ